MKTETPIIIQANADGSLKEPPPKPPEPIPLFPFEDGTVLKYTPRVPAVGDQQVIVNFRGDQLAIARDQNCAAMITDGVNLMFVALMKKQDIENEILARAVANATPPPTPPPTPPTEAPAIVEEK